MTVFRLVDHTTKLPTLTQVADPSQTIAQAINALIEDQLAVAGGVAVEDNLVNNWASSERAVNTTSTRKADSWSASNTPPAPKPMDILAIGKAGFTSWSSS